MNQEALKPGLILTGPLFNEPMRVETYKGVVRLLPVSERAKQLFGKDGATAVADRFEQLAGSDKPVQLTLFSTEDERPDLVAPKKKGRRKAGGDAPQTPCSGLSGR